jgi:6-phosphogluconolactonase (cycloisomerase 2 family)
VQNAQYLAAIEEDPVGRARLSRVDVNDGTLTPLGNHLTGGDDPYDVIFEKGYFLVVHRSSNDVAVLELDDQSEQLTPVAGSPFACDGIGSRHLVTNGAQVFVSNTDSQSITIFDFDTATGALELHAESNVPAAGCRGMAIRSAWLYVASQASDEILIFDIAGDGELFQNVASPVSSGGLSGPVDFARIGTYLYAANESAGTLSAFSISGTGALIALAGSPFAISSSAQRLVANGTDLFAVSGSAAGVLSFDTDAFGVVTEDGTSPLALGGAGYAVATIAKVVVAATTTSEEYKVYTISSSGLTEAADSPVDAQAPILRAALSDE